MLTSSTLRRTSSSACATCARIALSSPHPSTRLKRYSPTPSYTSTDGSTTRQVGSKRWNASFAQSGSAIKECDPIEETIEEVEQDERDSVQQVESEGDDGKRQGNQSSDLDGAEVQGALDQVYNAINEQTSPSTSSSASSPTPSSSSSSPYKPSPICDGHPSEKSSSPPPPPPRLTLEQLVSNPIDSTSSGPTIQDLSRLSPKRFEIPSSTSPDSHRTVYRRLWDKTYSKLNSSFSKLQIQSLCSLPPPLGLSLDIYSGELTNKLRIGTKGKKHKWWKPKRFDQMSKRELIQTILVCEFDMVDPDLVPGPNRGPRVTDAVPLSDRTLFLLLSPNCPVIPKIANHLGIKVSFARHPTTQILSLVLHGSKPSVASARLEVESIDETCTRKEIKLGRETKSLRPEVYQTVSRLAKTFLEPGQEPDTLIASATEPKSIIRLERLLSATFSSSELRASTPLFASLPTSLSRVRYSLYPFEPLSLKEFPGQLESVCGSTRDFSRWRVVDVDKEGRGVEEGEGDREVESRREMDRWSEKMRLERSSRVPILLPGSRDKDKTPTSIFQALFNPFNNGKKEKELKEDEDEEEKFELRAEMGHLVFPLYKETASTTEGNGRFEPVLDGKWGWEKWVNWIKGKGKNESVWVPSTPQGLLKTTGLASPLPSTSSLLSPFSSLLTPFPSSSTSPSSPTSYSDYDNGDSPLTPEQIDSLSKSPTFESTSFRRFIYYPAQLPSPSSSQPPPSSSETTLPLPRLEMTLRTDRSNLFRGYGSSGGERITKVQVELIKESRVDVFVPTGKNDLRIKLRKSRNVREEELTVGSFKLGEGLSLFETLASAPSQSPFELTYDSTLYMLHTSSILRQTLINPPSTPSSSTTTTREGLEAYPLVQETITNFLPEPQTKTTFEYLLTKGQKVTRDEIRNGSIKTSAEGEGDEVVKKTKSWKEVLEALEKKCRQE